VLGPDLAGAVALVALLDAGLDAHGVGGPLTPAAAALLTTHGRGGRWLTGPDTTAGTDTTASAEVVAGSGSGTTTLTVARAAGGAQPEQGFEISLGGRRLGHWDAVVVTARGLVAVAGVVPAAAPWYGGVFHPVADRVYILGVPDTGQVAPPDGERELAFVRAQAGWVAEYLRGRYQLPAYQIMISQPGLRRVGLSRRGAGAYLRALERELRAGRARAAAAGYPLPLPGMSPGAQPLLLPGAQPLLLPGAQPLPLPATQPTSAN